MHMAQESGGQPPLAATISASAARLSGGMHPRPPQRTLAALHERAYVRATYDRRGGTVRIEFRPDVLPPLG